jgi:hypothetical protein
MFKGVPNSSGNWTPDTPNELTKLLVVSDYKCEIATFMMNEYNLKFVKIGLSWIMEIMDAITLN